MNSSNELGGSQNYRSQFSVGRVYRKAKKMLRQIRRRQIRSRVALTAPSPHANQDMPFSPHCLTSHQDLLMAICSAKSLNLAAEEALPWVFHEDGSLTAADKQLLLCHFPGCSLIDRAKADEFFKKPHLELLAQARQKYVLLLKLADLHVFARHERILYVDSDVLFFRKPQSLFHAIEKENGNYFTKDIGTSYVANLEVLEKMTGVRPLERVNSGIFALNRGDVTLDKIAHTLSRVDASKRPDWSAYSHLIEQTLVAILTTASASGATHLPPEFDLYLEGGLQGNICRHYVGVIREQFELEGLRTLLSEMQFLDRWQHFVQSGHGS